MKIFPLTALQPWPLIEKFLKEQGNGSVGLDIGCGNGKYLAINRNVFIVGSDRSTNLVRIAKQHQSHDAVVADILDLPHPKATFDFAISIAVIHHLSTRERRVKAIRSILELLKRDGKALLYVWALEQASSRRGWDEGDEQDVMVPWVTRSKSSAKTDSEIISSNSNQAEKTFQRYYHLYRKGELEEDVENAEGKVLENGYEKDNWWAIVTSR